MLSRLAVRFVPVGILSNGMFRDRHSSPSIHSVVPLASRVLLHLQSY